MKISKKSLLTILLVISLICNAFLCFSLIQERKPTPSIIKFGYDELNTVIYCEKSDRSIPVKLNYEKNIFTIDISKLLYENDSIYFITPYEKINLSDYEGVGYVINDNGELLYSLNTPAKKQQMVYITPSGKKYHLKKNCAGKNGIKIEFETALLLKEPCSICT